MLYPSTIEIQDISPEHIILDITPIQDAMYEHIKTLKECEFCLPDAINILCDYVENQEEAEIGLQICLDDIMNDHAINDAIGDGVKIVRATGILGSYLIDVFRSTNAYGLRGQARYVLEDTLRPYDEYVLRKVHDNDPINVT